MGCTYDRRATPAAYGMPSPAHLPPSVYQSHYLSIRLALLPFRPRFERRLLAARTEPTILYLDIGGLVKRRLESLSELLPGHDVSVLVRKVPRLLTTNVSSLAQKVRSLLGDGVQTATTTAVFTR